MRHAIPTVLAVVGVLAAPVASADSAPRVLVLRSSDVPAGFVVDRKETGVRTNEVEAGTDRRSRALIERLGRVTGYQAEWRRGTDESIVSRADVFRTKAGAQSYVSTAAAGFRTSGIKGLRRSTIRLGDQGYVFHAGASAQLAWVVWRSGEVCGVVVGWGVPRDVSIALARKQQRRIASAAG